MLRNLFLILMLCLPFQSFAELRAEVDRNRLSINETLTLTVSTDAQVDTQALDFSALSNDFEILASSPQSSISIINGRQSALTRWVITLLPRRTGTLEIPELDLNGETTDAILVDVSQVSQRVGDSPITAQIELRDTSIYVNEQLMVTVSLISSPQVTSLSGEQLQIDNADVTLLDQQNFSRVVNGDNWRVNQWRYAVFSRSPGQLHIPAQTFSGVIGSTTRSPFDPFGSIGRRILARSEPLDIQVSPAPAGAANWLPARDINLEVIWSGDPNSLEVGEPMTRTIVTSAVGQQAAALPPLETLPSIQYKVYADQPALSERPTGQALTAERRDAAAIVPAEAGEIQFPEIRIPWWDIESESWQEAVLPSETIQVAAASSAIPLNLDPATPARPAPDLTPAPEPVTLSPAENATSPLMKWAVGLLLGLSLILGLDNLRLRRQSHLPTSSAPVSKVPTAKALWQKLMQAVKTASPVQIRADLLAWADQRWPDAAPHNLHGLRELCSADLQVQIRILEAGCAGISSEPLDRTVLSGALQTWHAGLGHPDTKKTGGLPELYPG